MTKKETDPFERLSASARKIWLAGLGAIAEAEKRGDQLFESLVKSGESFEEDLKNPLGKAGGAFKESVETARTRASSAFQDLEGMVDRRVDALMKSMGLARSSDVESLRRELNELRMRTAQQAGAKRASKKKAAKKKG
jgi:poly(hydroxyalkanoate) granule-associated protein